MLTACGKQEDGKTKIVLTTGFSENEVFKIGSSSCDRSEIMVYLTNMQNQYDDMKLRIKYMYEAGNDSAFETLVTSDDFTDLLSKAEYVQNVHSYDRKQLQGDFCRGCGYCMPCSAGIEINNCARMSLLLRRSPSELQLTPEVQAKMMKIEDCMHCGHCRSMCPYHLDTPALLAKNLEDYKNVLSGKVKVC